MPSASFHTGVSLRGFHFEDFILTFNLAAGTVIGDVGKAVAFDTTGPAKVKLAGDGDLIIGRLETHEDRKVEGTLVGAVALKFANILPIKTGVTLVPGDTVVGAGAGEIKKAAANDPRINFVSEIVGNFAVVVLV